MGFLSKSSTLLDADLIGLGLFGRAVPLYAGISGLARAVPLYVDSPVLFLTSFSLSSPFPEGVGFPFLLSRVPFLASCFGISLLSRRWFHLSFFLRPPFVGLCLMMPTFAAIA